MIEVTTFLQQLKTESVQYVTGVPDSLLSSFSACLLNQENYLSRFFTHVIAANEGNAVALAAGNYMATGAIPLVYMQNSGTGNIVNPVASLLHPDIYGIPVLFLIGWRGEPGVPDEPQHLFQGRITQSLMEVLEIPCEILSVEWEKARLQIAKAFSWMRERNRPYALLVSKDTFAPCPLHVSEESSHFTASVLLREQAVEMIAKRIPENAVIVSTTGKCSRELFEIRERNQQGHEKDFLTVGSMGHASSIALGLASGTSRPIVCLDGDGAVLMHMGAMAVLGQSGCCNLTHIVLNNGAHESVGGQPTVAKQIALTEIAKACGYTAWYQVKSQQELENLLQIVPWGQGPTFIEVRIGVGSRKDLGRPTTTPRENKEALMQFIKE